MSTVAKKVLMGSGAVAEFGIDQSAILDNAGNAHLKRTPSTAGNRRTFTLSCWIKRTKETANASIFTQGLHVTFDPALLQVSYYTAAGGHLIRLGTTAVFRDTAAWYHIVLAFDTTQGTATDRVKIYINGVRQTSFVSGQQTFPSQNLETSVNNTADVFYLGSLNATANSIGYLAETHFIDGTAKAASDFGETNDDTGQWIPKEYEGGSYGTNGFYLKFESGAIGTDSSGEGNDLTAVNLANADVVTDTPNNNFCTLNPLSNYNAALTEGNLVSAQAGHSDTTATFKIPHTGKWYFECVATTAGGAQLGIAKTTYQVSAGQWGSEQRIINVAFSNGNAGYNAGNEVSYIGSAISNGNTVGVAIDSDNGKIYYAKNNTWGNSGNPLNGTNPAATFTASDDWQPIVYGPSGAVQTFNFGQKSFAYTPPSGYVALSTANLPDPAIPLPSAHFNTLLYTSNNSTLSVTGAGFQPDFIWFKNRTNANRHALFDSVRGVTKRIASNATDAEVADPDTLTSFDSDGWSIGADTQQYGVNYTAGSSFVSWNWKANGSGSTDTSGDIDAVVSANQAAGFSIVTWTSNGSNAGTIPHGLGVTPELIFYKTRNQVARWHVFIIGLIDGSIDYMHLDDTIVKQNSLSQWGAPTSSMISNLGFSNTQPILAYNFVSKPGFSKMGTYTGNGSATAGPFVNCGFKPALVIRKRTDQTGDWFLYDAKINPINSSATGTGVSNIALWANTTSADEPNGDAGYALDILSNGFKTTTAGAYLNANNGVYLYMAFAESPFKYANAR